MTARPGDDGPEGLKELLVLSPPPERLYQLTRVGKGDYLLPSNDAQTIWRLHRYHEDGSAEYGDGKPVIGWFWQVFRFAGTMADAQRLAGSDPEEFLSWEHWQTVEMLLRTREAAIRAVIR